MANISTGINGKTYLITPEQFTQLPIGTKYQILCEDLNVFNGKMLILISNDSPANVLVQILGFSWEDAPEVYPNGVPVYDTGMIINIITNELIDPLAGTSDEILIQSMIFRGLHI